MKKIALIAGLLLMAFSCFAASLNSSQEKLRSDIMSFLRYEGYMPELDNDGDIKFKKEGSVFYVRVDPNETSPMYVKLFTLYDKPSNYDINVVKLASAELNFYKGGKCTVYDNGTISLQADLFMNSVDTFKAVFNRLMKSIGYMAEDILDECKSAAAAF